MGARKCKKCTGRVRTCPTFHNCKDCQCDYFVDADVTCASDYDDESSRYIVYNFLVLGMVC